MTRGIWPQTRVCRGGECYYCHDFKEKGIRLITLNQYSNDDLEENEYWEAIDYDPSLGKMSFNTSYTYDESNPLKLNCGITQNILLS